MKSKPVNNNYWQFAAKFLRSITSIIAALIASAIPLPDALRFMVSNALAQMCDVLATWMETEIAVQSIGTMVMIPATRKLVKSNEVNLANIFTDEFCALVSFLQSHGARLRVQKMYCGGAAFDVPIFCEPIVATFRCSPCEHERDADVVYRKIKLSLFTCEKGDVDKKILHLGGLEQIMNVVVALEFANLADEVADETFDNEAVVDEDKLRSPTQMLDIVLQQIIKQHKKQQEDKEGNDAQSKRLQSTEEVLKKPGVSVHRKTDNGSNNYLFEDVLVILSSLAENAGRLEVVRTLGSSITAIADIPKVPIAVKTEHYGTVTFLYVCDDTVSSLSSGAPMVSGGSGSVSTYKNANEYLFVSSSLGRKKTLEFLYQQVQSTNSSHSSWQPESIPIYSLIVVDKKNSAGIDSGSRTVWVKQNKTPTRTLRTSFYTTNVAAEVFGRIKAIQSKRDLYARAAVPTKIGFVLHGPQGSGKSTIPSVVAHELGCVPLIVFSFANVHSGAEFSHATALLRSNLPANDAPCVIQIDDIEKSTFFKNFLTQEEKDDDQKEEKKGSSSAGGGDGGGGGKCCDLAIFLNWIDGVESGASRVLFVSVNDLILIKRVDQLSCGSLLRSGRLNHIVHVGRSDRQQFTGFYQHVFGVPFPADETFDSFDKFTIADLQAMLIESEFDSGEFLRVCRLREVEAKFESI